MYLMIALNTSFPTKSFYHHIVVKFELQYFQLYRMMALKPSVFPCLILYLYSICISNTVLTENDVNHCKNQNLKPWIYFQHNVCVQLIINANQYHPVCISKFIDQLIGNGIVIQQKSLVHMISRNISNERKTNCESFLIVMENPQDWIEEINRQTHQTK